MLRRRPRHRDADRAALAPLAASTWSAAERELLAADPALARVMRAGGPLSDAEDRRGSRPDPYEALARAIVGQQLSTRAAASIWERLVGGFAGRVPSASEIVAADPQVLRDAGLSWPKVAYLRDLGERVADGELDLGRLAERDDEAVIAELTRVKGIGRWTAEMFLIFHLGRPDVVSVGDLGIRRATQLALGLEELPAPTELQRIAEAWRPHRSLACIHLWRSLRNAPA